MSSELTREQIERRLQKARKHLEDAEKYARSRNAELRLSSKLLIRLAHEEIAILTLALRAFDMEPKPINEAEAAYQFPLESSGLSLRVGSDGVWLTFNAKSKRRIATINVRNKLGEPPERLGCINSWCDEIEEMAVGLRPLSALPTPKDE